MNDNFCRVSKFNITKSKGTLSWTIGHLPSGMGEIGKIAFTDKIFFSTGKDSTGLFL